MLEYGNKIIFNEDGAFVDVKYPGADNPLNVELGVWQNHKIKISDKKLKLNEHGGYVSDEIKEQCRKQFISIHPSAIVGDIKIGKNVRGMTIGRNCIISDGVSFKSDKRDFKITIEDGVIIGKNNILKNNLKIMRLAEIGEGNTFIGGTKEDFRDPAYNFYSIGMDTAIGNNNKFYGEFAVGDGCHIGNDNEFGDDIELGHFMIIKNFNLMGDFTIFGDDIKIGSNSYFDEFVGVKSNCIIKDFVHIKESSSIGRGCEFENDVKIDSDCEISEECKFQEGAKVGYNSEIGAKSNIGKDSEIGAYCKLGYGVIVKPKVKVRHHSTASAGKVLSSVNVKDFENY